MNLRQQYKSIMGLAYWNFLLVAFGGGDMWGSEETEGLRYYDFLNIRYPFSWGDSEQNGFHPCGHDSRGRTDVPFGVIICPPFWKEYVEWVDVQLEDAGERMASGLGLELPELPADMRELRVRSVRTNG